jgi:hypothetical protein
LQTGRREALEDELLRGFERRIAGQPPQGRHERHDVHRRPGVDTDPRAADKSSRPEAAAHDRAEADEKTPDRWC